MPDTAENAGPAMDRPALLQELKWKKFPVLDDGFVCLVDIMGEDSSVVQAARVSYGEGTKKASDDRTLIRYLLRHRHTTPFEMVELKFLVRVPMDCWRQWIRHRTANVNEYSTRYSIAIDSMQTTPPNEWRTQSQTNKQGSEEMLSAAVGEKLTAAERELQETTRRVYQERLDLGVAREQARKDLPLSTYTEAYWKVDLHNLLHFLALRMDAHAQLEIREYSATIGRKIVQPLLPMVWEAFEDYRLNASGLSRLEIGCIQRLMQHASANGRVPPLPVADFLSVQDPTWRELTRSRERDECLAKLQELGLVAT